VPRPPSGRGVFRTSAPIGDAGQHEQRTRRARVRAPELIGKGGWLNTGGRHYTLADLRGRIVVLDFCGLMMEA